MPAEKKKPALKRQRSSSLQDKESTTSTSTTSSSIIPGKCDLCQKKDGHRGHNLQQCHLCGVCVHESCYGLIPSEEGQNTKLPRWECMACESLQWSPTETMNGLPLRHKERPTECALCCVSTGIHAMHPLYDDCGKEGKQIVLPAEKGRPRRLAWVHSLCAFYIGSYSATRGLVYSCDKNGSYGDSEDEDEDEAQDSKKNTSTSSSSSTKPSSTNNTNNNNNNDQDSSSVSSSDELLSTHHFVINNEPAWRQIRKESRQMKCHICGICDRHHPSSLRLTVQCSTNDEEELPEYATRHADPSPCFVAMHVGCARWGSGSEEVYGNGSGSTGQHVLKRLFFYPGKLEGVQMTEGDDFVEPVTLAYCHLHAKEILENKVGTSVTSRGKKPKPGTSTTTTNTSRKPTSALSPTTPSTQFHEHNDPITTTMIQNTQPNTISEWLPIVSQDVIRIIEQAQARNKKVQLVEVTTQRKSYWKTKAGLSKSEFKELWGKVKGVVSKHVFTTTTAAAGSGGAGKKKGMSPPRRNSSSSSLGTDWTSGEERMKAALQAKDEENPWRDLWVPNYRGTRFEIGSWDTVEEVKLPDRFWK